MKSTMVKAFAKLRPDWLLLTAKMFTCAQKTFHFFSRRCVPRPACSFSRTLEGASQAEEGELMRSLHNGPVCFSLGSNKQDNSTICGPTICSAGEANRPPCRWKPRMCLIKPKIDASLTCLGSRISESTINGVKPLSLNC